MSLQKIKNRIPLILLILIVLAALLVRVWGCAYGKLNSWNHDEQIHLRTALLVYNGEMNTHKMWAHRYGKYVLYPWFGMYLVALILRLYTAIGSMIAFTLSNSLSAEICSRLAGLSSREALLIGRLTIALIGTLTVPVVYAAGKLIRDRSTALLAAAFIAFNGYHVANCHWLKNDIIATFFLSLAFLYAAKILIRGRPAHYFLAAVFSVLAIVSKYNTFPVVAVVIFSHLRRGKFTLREVLRGLVARKILYFYLTCALTMIAAWPIIYLDFDYFRTRLIEWFVYAPQKEMFAGVDKYSEARGYWNARLINTINFFLFSIKMVGGMGPYVTLLGLGGIFISFWKKERRLTILIVFPIIYSAMVIFLAPGLRNQDIIPLYPFFSLLAAFFIDFVAKMVLGPGWRRKTAVTLLGGAALIPYILTVTRMDYGYWQPSAPIIGSKWAARHIPPGSKIAYESKTIALSGADYRKVKIRRLWGGDVRKFKRHGFEYLITTSRHELRALEKFGLFGPDHPFGKFYLSLPSEYDLIKSFDMSMIPYKAGYPKIYRLKKTGTPCDSGIESGFLRRFQSDYSVSSASILFLNEQGQGEGDTNCLVEPGAPINKLLISPSDIPEIGVQLLNGGRPAAPILKIGGKRVTASLSPAETRIVTVHPATGFPYIEKSYRLKAHAANGGPTLIRILPDAFRIGLGFFEEEKWEEAIVYLKKSHRQNPGDWYMPYLLSRACQEAGRDDEAGKFRETAENLFPELPSFLNGLTGEDLENSAWDERFQEWTGFDPAWLQERAGRHWSGEQMSMVAASPGSSEGRTPNFCLPPGGYEVRFAFQKPGGEMAESVKIRLYRNGRPARTWLLEYYRPDPGWEFISRSFGDELMLTIEGDISGMKELLVVPSLRSWFKSVFPPPRKKTTENSRRNYG